MVLKSNYARRTSNAENVHPNPNRRFSSKRTSSFRSSIQLASRRRRARTTGHHDPRYVAEQAKRRSTTRSPAATVRLDVASETNDVDMNGVERATGPSSPLKGTQITLPRYLARPDYREIRMETLMSIDPEFADVPLEYIKEGLESTGPA
jgi:hypothetical protein